jgi:flagellar hook-basal body complex protein FliE
VISPLTAAKAYAATQSQLGITDTASIGAPAAGAGGQSFEQVLTNVLNDTVQNSRAAETQMVAGVQGKADLIDVVTAISSAEQSLETVMAVRDQVISAYQEIMRMPI